MLTIFEAYEIVLADLKKARDNITIAIDVLKNVQKWENSGDQSEKGDESHV